MQPVDAGFDSSSATSRRVGVTRPIQVIAVTSGKGGVGKTTVSINLAMAMASLGRAVLLLDADLGLANVDVMLGLKPEKNLSHVIDGACALEDILLPGPGGIKIIPASSGIQRMTELSVREHAGLVNAFSELAGPMDVLIIDTPAGISESVIRFCAAAQEVVVVVCNEPASITDAYAMIKILHQEHRISRFRVLVNMTHGEREGQYLFDKLDKVTQRFLDVSLDLIGAIPYDVQVRTTALQQRALLEAGPASPAAKALRGIASRINQWPRPDVASGRVEFFWDRLVKWEQSEWEVQV